MTDEYCVPSEMTAGRGPRRPDRGIKKGGMNDPVARSIRNQQNADAAPSAAEAKRQHHQFLTDEGCRVCGFADDPERLQAVRIPPGRCKNAQQPPDDPADTVVFCDEHARPGSTLARAREVQAARRAGHTEVIWYDCGAVVTAGWDYDDVSSRPHGDIPELSGLSADTKLRFGAGPPEVAVIHPARGCGAGIEETTTIDPPAENEDTP